MYNVGEFVIGQLSLFAWREGKRLSPGCRAAYLGIAHIIKNRVESGWINGDWLRLIEDAPIHGADDMAAMDWRSMPDIHDKDFIWLHSMVGMLYDRKLDDQVTAAANTNWTKHQATMLKTLPRRGLFYCNLQLPIRPWFREKIICNPTEHPRQAEAGTVTFFG